MAAKDQTLTIRMKMDKIANRFLVLVALDLVLGGATSAMVFSGYPGINIVNLTFGSLCCMVFQFQLFFGMLGLSVPAALCVATLLRILVWVALSMWNNSVLRLATETIISVVGCFAGYELMLGGLQ